MAERKKKTTKRKFRYGRFISIVLILFGIWYYNNYTVKITRETVTVPDITAPVRIAVVSDLHCRRGCVSPKKVKKQVDRISPDAVMILGDMYCRSSVSSDKDKAAAFIADIASEYQTFYVSGDHDTSKKFAERLAAKGVNVMNYRSGYYNIGGQDMHIMGIDNVYYSKTFDLGNEFRTDPVCCDILLAHIPNHSKFSAFGADLVLSADTHGGMVRLPFIGPVYDSLTDSFLPKLRGITYFDKGLYSCGSGKLFITSGIGVSPYPIRFWNRPEVVELELLPEEK